MSRRSSCPRRRSFRARVDHLSRVADTDGSHVPEQCCAQSHPQGFPQDCTPPSTALSTTHCGWPMRRKQSAAPANSLLTCIEALRQSSATRKGPEASPSPCTSPSTFGHMSRSSCPQRCAHCARISLSVIVALTRARPTALRCHHHEPAAGAGRERQVILRRGDKRTRTRAVAVRRPVSRETVPSSPTTSARSGLRRGRRRRCRRHRE